MVRVRVYDYRWNDDTVTTKFQASAVDRFGEKNLQLGDLVSLEITGETYCAGSMRDGVWQKCLHQVAGRKKCEACRSREGNFVFTSFDGFNTDFIEPQDLARIQGEHVVYLALFQSNLIKVGVSKLDRKTLRQIEQGSEATLYIAQTPDGVLARQIETTIRNSGLQDKIAASQKKEHLCPEITATQAEDRLREVFAAHKSALEHFPHLQVFLLDMPEFCQWQHHYQTDFVRQSSKIFHVVSLEPGEILSGYLRARKGSFLMLETEDEIVGINAKDLQGKEVEFETKPVGLKLNKAMQGALF